MKRLSINDVKIIIKFSEVFLILSARQFNFLWQLLIKSIRPSFSQMFLLIIFLFYLLYLTKYIDIKVELLMPKRLL